MSNRPGIPAEVSRQVLIESGHRCAVCGDSCPRERAHIIPFCDSQDYGLENLICLCANCHERADKEQWGERTLREYKRRPWVLRKYTAAAAPQPKMTRVEISVDLEYEGYDQRSMSHLQHELAGFLNIPPEYVKFKSVSEGSVRRDMESRERLPSRRPDADQATYQQWWELHLRVAHGESLSPDEQSSYDAGLRELEQEKEPRETTDARESREQLAALEAEHANLEKSRQQLDAEITELESRLSDQTRQYLRVED